MNEPQVKPTFLARLALCLATAGCCMFVGAPAYAQEQAAEATGLEEIVVTARFREENLQETPIAITAISGDEVVSRGMNAAFEIGYTVPNASLRPAQAAFGNTMSAYIRGIGQYDFLPEFEPGVAIYFDDVLHPVTMGSMIDLMDLERIEVLRGPQGTLFGRGSIGGAIRYISKKPEGTDTGSIAVTYGDFNRIDVRASYDFKLSDTVFARVTGVAKTRDGHQDVLDFACVNPVGAGYGDGLAADGVDVDTAPDVVTAGSAADNSFAIPQRIFNRGSGCKVGTQGGEDVTGARASVRFAPSDTFDLTVSADYLRDDSEARADTLVHVAVNPMTGQLPVPFNFWSNGLVSRFGVPYDSRFLPPDIYTTYATYGDPVTGISFQPKTALEQKSVSTKADVHFSDTTLLEIIGSYSEFDSLFATDADGSPYNEQTVDGRQSFDSKTIEARLSGRAMDRLDWTVGAFWYQGDFTSSQQVSIGAFQAPTARFLVNGLNNTKSENRSIFAHSVFDVTDKFAVTAGVRYSEDDKDELFDNSIVQAAQNTSDDHFDWKIGADFKFTDGLMVYASAATGYRPQAFNPRPFQPTQFVGVDGEEATSYELGFKADFADNRVRLNLAGFMVDYNQRILPVGGTECTLLPGGPPYVYNTIPPATGTPIPDSLGNQCVSVTSRTFYENIPAEITGAELEFAFAPVDGLTISGSFGYTDFQGDEFDDPSLLNNPAVTSILSDNPIYVPEQNWSVGFAYKFGAGAGGASITPRLDYYGQSAICPNIRTNSTLLSVNTTEAQSCADAYEIANARIEWANGDDTWRVALGLTNITDEEYFLNKFDLTGFGQPTVEGQPGRPREWYLSFTRNFN